jgi:hypothetical protein
MQGYPPNFAQVAQPQSKPNTMAKYAMWAGLASLVCWCTGPLALGLGLLARSEISKAPGQFNNDGQAKTGIIVGAIGTVLLVAAGIVSAFSKTPPASTTTHAPTGAAAAEPKRAPADPARAPEPKPEPVAEAPVSVTAMELFSAYDANEVAADTAYKGKTLRVSGKVAGIDKDFTDTVIVKLQTSNQFMDVMAYDVAPDVAGNLRKGQALTLTCRGEGRVMGSPVLRRCK